MQFRLKTSKQTEEIFDKINKSEHLQPFILSKIAISLAIKNKFTSFNNKDIADNNGLDLNRQTITGDYDLLFKSLIELNEGRYISDNEYFPSVLKMYLDFGATILEKESKYSRNIYSHLINLEDSI